MIITKTFAPQFGAPLGCDCNGAAVYLVPASEYAELALQGYFKGVLAEREQIPGGAWLYTFDVPDEQFPEDPTIPDVEWIDCACCVGCYGQVMEALLANVTANAPDSWDRFILSAEEAVTPGTLHFGFVPRPFAIEDGIRISWPVAGMAGTSFSVQIKVGGMDLHLGFIPSVPTDVNTYFWPASNIQPSARAGIAAGLRVTVQINSVEAEGYGAPRGLEVAFLGRWLP